jgi:CHRD domain
VSPTIRRGAAVVLSAFTILTFAAPAVAADAYYVNVHNAPYPAGALRGQLSR